MTKKEFAINCSKSFDYFVRKALKADPNDEQQEFIDAVQDAIDGNGNPNISIRSGHGTGKTAGLAWLILWIGHCFKDVKMPTTAPVSAQLTNILLPEVSKWNKRSFPPMAALVEVQSLDVKFANGNHCFARTARKENTEALAGVHASLVVYIVDEASGIDQAVFDVIEGALTGDNYLFIMTSNPTRTTGTFFDSHNKKRKNYKCLHFDSSKSKNVNKKWVAQMAEKYGEDSDVFRVRVKGKFPKTNNSGLFSTDIVERAMNRIGDKSGPHVLAVDVARYGDDKSAHCRREGLYTHPFEMRAKQSTTETTGWTINAINKHKIDGTVVDTIGIGAGVYDQITNQGYYCIDGNFGLSADEDTYLNKRAECFFRLRESLDKGLSLPDDDELLEELVCITYSFTEKGKIKIKPKEEIKDELGRSPDKADALALTFFTQIHKEESSSELGNYYDDDIDIPNLV
ncbi:hypothetical protein [Sulfurimonas sp.]|uniref:hypothetical protein n=1 Tax=Sulfurimonas sp. TaxID=2022749 RepID=UPI00356783AA